MIDLKNVSEIKNVVSNKVIESIKDNLGNIIYEAYKILSKIGVPPLTINSKGEPLINYKIYGESVQNGTPTSETPIEVESVGTKTSNLFDINSGFALNQNHAPTIIEGTNIITPYSGSNNMGAEFLQFIPIEENETYTCKFDLIQGKVRILIRLYDEAKQLITDSVSVSGFRFNAYYQGIYSDVNESTVSFPSNVKYIRLCTVQMNNSEIVDNIYSNYQFVKGTEVTEYEPFGYKIPVKVRGKNVYSAKTEFKYNRLTAIDTFKVKPNTDYIISVDKYTISQPEWSIKGVAEPVENLTVDQSWATGTSIALVGNTFNSGEYEYIIMRSWYENSVYGSDENSKIQVEEGTEITAYEPYIEPITTYIYLKEPLRKIGDSIDYIDFENSKVIRANKKMTDFTTSLYWTYSSGYFGCTAYLGANTTERGKALCNYYMYGNATNDYCFWIDSSGQGIRFRNKDYTDVDSFKNWLSTIDIYMIYPLATPVEETIELPNIPTIKGTTILEVDGKVQPSNMEVTYKGK